MGQEKKVFEELLFNAMMTEGGLIGSLRFVMTDAGGAEGLFRDIPVEDHWYEHFDLMGPRMFEDARQGATTEEGTGYLVALLGEHPVGVLKWKRYGIPDHRFVPEDKKAKPNYLAIRLLDVRDDVRQKGVALMLLRRWRDEFLDDGQVVVGGKATASGRSTGIHRWMGRELLASGKDIHYHESEVGLTRSNMKMKRVGEK